MHKRAWRLFDLSRNKTSPGDDGSFFLRAQVTYVSAAAAKGAHVYFLCTDTLTHDMELLFRNASLDATTGGTCVISRRARRCCAEARYRRRPRGISDRCSRLIGRLCNATAPGASKRGCGSEIPTVPELRGEHRNRFFPSLSHTAVLSLLSTLSQGRRCTC